MRTALLVMALAGCSTVPMEHHGDYNSLIDYLKRGYSPSTLSRYSYFDEEKNPLEISLGPTRLAYIGDAHSNGYYLRVSTPLIEGTIKERVFCSLHGSLSLDAYSEGLLTSSGEILTYATWFIRENPHGPNGRSWEELQEWFAHYRQEFMAKVENNPLYRDALTPLN